MNEPQPGDRIRYFLPFREQLLEGIIAERAISPLTGNPRYRVVDCHAERKDPEAGRWVGVEDVYAIDGPGPADEPVVGMTSHGLCYATLDGWRVVAYAEGGYQVTRYVGGGIGWILSRDDCPESVEHALCAALRILYVS